jgi:hypothetical protein
MCVIIKITLHDLFHHKVSKIYMKMLNDLRNNVNSNLKGFLMKYKWYLNVKTCIKKNFKFAKRLVHAFILINIHISIYFNFNWELVNNHLAQYTTVQVLTLHFHFGPTFVHSLSFWTKLSGQKGANGWGVWSDSCSEHKPKNESSKNRMVELESGAGVGSPRWESEAGVGSSRRQSGVGSQGRESGVDSRGVGSRETASVVESRESGAGVGSPR